MDIGTAKPTRVERSGVPHHLLDVWPITKSAAVAEYQALAALARSRRSTAAAALPILVGGSGLYLRGVLDELTFPGESPADPSPTGRRAGRGRAGARCTRGWPSSTRRRPRRSCRRTAGGSCARSRSSSSPAGRSSRPCRRSSITRIRSSSASIAPTSTIGSSAGSTAMMAAGLLDEVRGLLPAGLRDSPTAGKALGYAQLLACLDDDGAGARRPGRGGRRHGPRHPAIRAPAAVLVSPRPPHPLARRRRAGSIGARAGRRPSYAGGGDGRCEW